MKKFLPVFLIFIVFNITAFAQDITVCVDDEKVNMPTSPIIENGRTMVGVRGVFEHLGAEVLWESGAVRIVNDEDEILLGIGDDWLFFNGEKVMLDTVTKIVNDRTYIPIRAVAELLDCRVEWNESLTRVDIYTGLMQENYLKGFEAFTLVNGIRKAYGLEEFLWSDELRKAAQSHARDMYARKFFSHDNPDGKSPFERMSERGIEYLFAAENIAADYTSAKNVTDGWMMSESHRENILNPYLKKVGIGYYKGYWCQEFTD